MRFKGKHFNIGYYGFPFQYIPCHFYFSQSNHSWNHIIPQILYQALLHQLTFYADILPSAILSATHRFLFCQFYHIKRHFQIQVFLHNLPKCYSFEDLNQMWYMQGTSRNFWLIPWKSLVISSIADNIAILNKGHPIGKCDRPLDE